jgi:benzoylformate decarboxylase
MARSDRPVLALLGDGSSLYSIQTLWSAAHYGVGVVFVVLGNGRYAVLDELARAHGGTGAWPSFDSVEPATIAAGLGCPSERITTHDELVRTLDEVIPSLRERTTPLLLDVRVAS